MLADQGLAPRESQVAVLTLLGLSSDEVGARLGIKAASARSTLHRVYKKLGVSGARGLFDHIGADAPACESVECSTIKQGVNKLAGEDRPCPKERSVAAVSSKKASVHLACALVATGLLGFILMERTGCFPWWIQVDGNVLAVLTIWFILTAQGRTRRVARRLVEPPSEKPASGAERSCARPNAAAASLSVSATALFGLLFTPLPGYTLWWGFGRMTVLGTLVGFVGFGWLHVYVRWLRVVRVTDWIGRIRLVLVGPGVRSPRLRVEGRLLLLAVCVAVFGVTGYASIMRYASLNLAMNRYSVLEFGFHAAAAALFLALAARVLRAPVEGAQMPTMMACVLLIVFFCSDAFLNVNIAYVFALTACSIVFCVTSIWAPAASPGGLGSTGPARPPDMFPRVAFCLLACAFGLAWEESWRSMAMFSGVMSIAFFVVATLSASVWLAWRSASVMRQFAFLLVLMIPAVIVPHLTALWDIPVVFWPSELFPPASAALQLAAIGSVCIIAWRAHELSALSTASMLILPFSAAGGASAGFLLMNLISPVVPDIMSKSAITSGAVIVLTGVTIAFAALFLGASALAVALCRYLVGLERGVRLGERTGLEEGTLRHRPRAHFSSRGASDTQASVLTEIALGQRTAEICERLHYSPGTVNVARAVGYRLVGVHDRMGLQRTVSQLLAM